MPDMYPGLPHCLVFDNTQNVLDSLGMSGSVSQARPTEQPPQYESFDTKHDLHWIGFSWVWLVRVAHVCPQAFCLCSSLISRSPVCVEILSCKGDHVRMAVRVKIFVYPEDVCAVWLMFAVKYRSIV